MGTTVLGIGNGLAGLIFSVEVKLIDVTLLDLVNRLTLKIRLELVFNRDNIVIMHRLKTRWLTKSFDHFIGDKDKSWCAG